MLRSKIRAFIGLIIMGAFLFYGFAHPFYLSVTNIKYNKQEKWMEISVKIFANDLESSLSKLNNSKVDLIHPNDKETTGVLLFKYLQNHLNLNVNGKNQTIKYLGYEMESEACWIYLQSSCLEAPKTIMVENSILYDSQIKQSNIVQVEIDENKQSAKLSYPDKHLIFNF